MSLKTWIGEKATGIPLGETPFDTLRKLKDTDFEKKDEDGNSLNPLAGFLKDGAGNTFADLALSGTADLFKRSGVHVRWSSTTEQAAKELLKMVDFDKAEWLTKWLRFIKNHWGWIAISVCVGSAGRDIARAVSAKQREEAKNPEKMPAATNPISNKPI